MGTYRLECLDKEPVLRSGFVPEVGLERDEVDDKSEDGRKQTFRTSILWREM